MPKSGGWEVLPFTHLLRRGEACWLFLPSSGSDTGFELDEKLPDLGTSPPMKERPF
jgi:hypothetical protein